MVAAVRTHYGSTFLGQGLILGMGVLTGILAARMLGPTGRGELAAILVWPMAIVTIVCLGLNQAIAYALAQRRYSIDEVFAGTLVIGAVQAVVSTLAALVIIPLTLARYSPEVRHLGIVFGCFLPALIWGGYPGNVFQGRQDLRRFNFLRLVPAAVYLAGLVLLYSFRINSLKGVVGVQICGFVVALVLGAAMVRRYYRPGIRWNRSVVPFLLSYGWKTQLTNLTNTFNQRVDQLILSLFVAPQQLGLYAVAVTLSNTVAVFPQAAGIVTFSRGSAQAGSAVHETIGRSFRSSLLWLLVCCAALFVVAPLLVHLVFGERFAGSAIACRILLPGALMLGLNQVLYGGASALGHPGLPSIAEGVSMGVTSVGLYLLVPRYGYLGAAGVSTVAYTTSFVIMLVLCKFKLGISVRRLFFPERKVVKPAALAAVADVE